MSNGQRTGSGPLAITLGFAAHEGGRGVAYAAIDEPGESPEIVRVAFALTMRPTLRGQDVAYAALYAVTDELLQRGLRDIELRVEDERIAVDLAERRKVATPLIVPYVALRCRLNRFSRANVVVRQSRIGRDLTNRARAEASLQIPA